MYVHLYALTYLFLSKFDSKFYIIFQLLTNKSTNVQVLSVYFFTFFSHFHTHIILYIHTRKCTQTYCIYVCLYADMYILDIRMWFICCLKFWLTLNEMKYIQIHSNTFSHTNIEIKNNRKLRRYSMYPTVNRVERLWYHISWF